MQKMAVHEFLRRHHIIEHHLNIYGEFRFIKEEGRRGEKNIFCGFMQRPFCDAAFTKPAVM
jgi:hypothetical protein